MRDKGPGIKDSQKLRIGEGLVIPLLDGHYENHIEFILMVKMMNVKTVLDFITQI